MSLLIIISRFSNFLFFVKETSRHGSIKLDLQKYLTNESLNISSFGKNENEIWKQIEKSIGKQDTKKIKRTITSLSPAFIQYWRKESKHLSLWKKYFQNNRWLLRQIVSNVKKLSGVKRFNIYKIPIYLISNPINTDKEIKAWFSWTPKENFIVVEVPSKSKVPNNLFPLSVLAHEIFHLILRQNKNLFSKITKIAKENKRLLSKSAQGMPNRIFLEELLVSSFVPEGYLSEKYLHTRVTTYKAKPNDLLGWRKFIAFKLYQIAKDYTDHLWQIDEKYLQELVNIIKQNTK